MGGVVFHFLSGANYIGKRGEIELIVSQLITDMKSYMGFRFVQKSITLKTLPIQGQTPDGLRAMNHIWLAQGVNNHTFADIMNKMPGKMEEYQHDVIKGPV